MASNKCVWEFDGTDWTIQSSDCDSGYVCAKGADSGGTVTLSAKGQKVPDVKFREGLNDSRLKATGIATDVIPKALTLRPGSTYSMECVKS